MHGRHFWCTRYHVLPLQSSSIAKCLGSFSSVFERPSMMIALLYILPLGSSLLVDHVFDPLTVRDPSIRRSVFPDTSTF